jgi:hypothetical protein
MSGGIVISVFIILLCLFGVHKFDLCRPSLICVAIMVIVLGTSSFFSAMQARRTMDGITNLLNVGPNDDENNKDTQR